MFNLMKEVMDVVSVQHPIIFQNYNICEMSSKSKLTSFSIQMLQEICDSLELDTSGLTCSCSVSTGWVSWLSISFCWDPLLSVNCYGWMTGILSLGITIEFSMAWTAARAGLNAISHQWQSTRHLRDFGLRRCWWRISIHSSSFRSSYRVGTLKQRELIRACLISCISYRRLLLVYHTLTD